MLLYYSGERLRRWGGTRVDFWRKTDWNGLTQRCRDDEKGSGGNICPWQIRESAVALRVRPEGRSQEVRVTVIY